jgi:hypothetical protein
MSGLAWLNGNSWWEVSRDERYFCAELYHLIREDTARFIAHLNQAHGAQLNPGMPWEVVYEACFYRDLWHVRGRADALVSPKRTFDLALFSDDDILLIEAKAQQEFDALQLQSFARDADEVKRLTGVPRVRLAALASSRYTIPSNVLDQFTGPHLRWLELARLFENNPKLLRADALFEPATGWTSANNSDGYMTGAELVAAFDAGERFFVGRRDGISGAVLKRDAETGAWRNQRYETNREAQQPPNRNWFGLEDFARTVRHTP